MTPEQLTEEERAAILDRRVIYSPPIHLCEKVVRIIDQLQDKLRHCLQKLGESDVRLGETMGRLNAATCRAYDAEEDVVMLQDIRKLVSAVVGAGLDQEAKAEAFDLIAGWLAEEEYTEP